MLPPQRLVLRFLVFVVVLGGGFAAMRWGPLAPYLTLDQASELLEFLSSQSGAPAIFVGGASFLMAFGLPASLTILVGGAVFGVLQGGVLSLLSLVVGALLSFALARWLAHDFVAHILGPRTKLVERLVGNHSFWGLVRLRFIPLPFPVINYGMALAGVNFGIFLLTTAVGVIPAVSVMSYFSASIVNAAEAERGEALLRVSLALLAMFALSLAPTLVKKLRARRERLRPPAHRS